MQHCCYEKVLRKYFEVELFGCKCVGWKTGSAMLVYKSGLNVEQFHLIKPVSGSDQHTWSSAWCICLDISTYATIRFFNLQPKTLARLGHLRRVIVIPSLE